MENDILVNNSFYTDEKFIIPAIIAVATIVVGIVLRRLLYVFLHRSARRSQSDNLKNFETILEESLRVPYYIWVIVLGIVFGLHYSSITIPEKETIENIVTALLLASLTIVIANVFAKFVHHYSRKKSGNNEMTSLSKSATYMVVYIFGAIFILNNAGVSITPLLTALGIGGLAVALAAQDTLTNLFAGFYISLSGQIRAGHYIKLNTGEEGYISDVTWRSTIIRNLSNNAIIIPNAKLAQANVTNYSLPDNRMSSGISVSVPYDCDLDKVEKILIEETTEAAKGLPGLIVEPKPNVTLIPGFSPASLDLSLNYAVAGFADQFNVQDVLRRRILARFRTENIALAYPLQTIVAQNLK